MISAPRLIVLLLCIAVAATSAAPLLSTLRILNSAKSLVHGTGTPVTLPQIDPSFYAVCLARTTTSYFTTELPVTTANSVTTEAVVTDQATATATMDITVTDATTTTTSAPPIVPDTTTLTPLSTSSAPLVAVNEGISFTIKIQASMSIALDNFILQTTLFVRVVAGVLYANTTDVTILRYSSGSTIAVFSVTSGYSGSDVKDMLMSDAALIDSDLRNVFGLQSVTIVGDETVAPSSASTTDVKSKPKPVTAIAVGVAIGFIVFILIVIAFAKRKYIQKRIFRNSAEADLRKLTKAIRNSTELAQLERLSREAEDIFKSECTCMSTGVCRICKEYKLFLQQCSDCRTEFVVSELTSIISRARGPDVVDIQAQLENAVDTLSSQCGCNFGRAWSEPAAEVCPHEALVSEFVEMVRVQNIQHLSNPPNADEHPTTNFETLPF